MPRCNKDLQIQIAPGFESGEGAAFKSRRDLNLAHALRSARFQSNTIIPGEKNFVRQHVDVVDRTVRFYPYRLIFFCPFSISAGCREYGGRIEPANLEREETINEGGSIT